MCPLLLVRRGGDQRGAPDRAVFSSARRLGDVGVPERGRREVLRAAAAGKIVYPDGVGEVVCDRLVDEAALAGGEDLLGLPEMLAPVVRLEADDVHRLDELVDRRHHGHAHLPHLCNVFRIAIGGREYVARPPLVGGRHAKALRPRRTVHVDDLRERDGVARVESDDADARLGDRAEDGKKRRGRHGHDLAVRATSGWRLPHSTPFPSFAAAGGSRNIVQSEC